MYAVISVSDGISSNTKKLWIKSACLLFSLLLVVSTLIKSSNSQRLMTVAIVAIDLSLERVVSRVHVAHKYFVALVNGALAWKPK